MSKFFNVSGACRPDRHYMVDLSSRLEAIKTMVNAGAYFTINRARQYGKTTLLRALSAYLKPDYITVSMDFQRMGASKFETENTFSIVFARDFIRKAEQDGQLHAAVLQPLRDAAAAGAPDFELYELFEYLSDICAKAQKPVVLLIDEVDTASNNQVFLDFLAQLRAAYLDSDITPTFHSVILAGVYDIRNIRRKLRPDEQHKTNSPWNIAADFDIDMRFSAKDIAGMLTPYESDHHTGMDVRKIAELIHEYTDGYPFLVSRICKLLDEKISITPAETSTSEIQTVPWSEQGVRRAVNILLTEKNTLFDSLIGQLHQYPSLKSMIYSLLFQGQTITYNADDPAADMLLMFGFAKAENGTLQIANRIFEVRLYNYFLTLPEEQNDATYKLASRSKNQFIRDGHLDMELLLVKFVEHFNDVYGDRGEEFLEEDGRRYFMLYLKPVINGTGNYYVEARTRNQERTDLIVDYLGEQFVIEMKIWRGNAYNERGEAQLMEYLDHYHLKTGYMLSFNFNKKKNIGVQHIQIGDKTLIEAVV